MAIRRRCCSSSACEACLIDVFRPLRIISLIILVTGMTAFAGYAASPPPRMRPYAGIGLIVFPRMDDAALRELRLPLYEEPGLSRIGELTSSRLPGNEWIFDQQEGAPPLIVSARKGHWLRVYHDDAGREAWLAPESKGLFLPWELFLKQRNVQMLPGLQPQYYQLHQQPGGKLLVKLTPKQLFKVLKVEDSWGMVLIGQTQIGWLRWCDEDGRILVGFSR